MNGTTIRGLARFAPVLGNALPSVRAPSLDLLARLVLGSVPKQYVTAVTGLEEADLDQAVRQLPTTLLADCE
jgi:hypothetical protein